MYDVCIYIVKMKRKCKQKLLETIYGKYFL